MIEVKNLIKCYGKKRALDDISFVVKEGEILGFLGPNGAGKSTTMNIITGYLSSTYGRVEIDGIDMSQKPLKAKQKIGYLPETPPLYQDMTVIDYLDFVYQLKKVKEDEDEHLGEICKIVGLTDVCNRLIKNLSKGYKQRVGLAQALVGFPPVLILDEPTVGLDPKQIIEIRNLIKNLSQKHTVILSSHVLPEIQAICERVLVINNGKIVADDTPEKLSASITGNTRLRVTIDGDKDKVCEVIKSVDGVVSVKEAEVDAESEDSETCSFDIECLPDYDLRKALAMAVNSTGAILLSAVNVQMSLEDIFLKLTEDDAQVSKETVETEGSDESKEDASAEDTAKVESSDEDETERTDKETTETESPDDNKEEASAEEASKKESSGEDKTENPEKETAETESSDDNKEEASAEEASEKENSDEDEIEITDKETTETEDSDDNKEENSAEETTKVESSDEDEDEAEDKENTETDIDNTEKETKKS